MMNWKNSLEIVASTIDINAMSKTKTNLFFEYYQGDRLEIALE